MSAQYQEYPVTLVHPHFQASKPIPIPGTQILGAQGEVVRQDYRGTPERFPPVTANNADEEERLKADGYERAGKVDPAAWVRAHADAPPADYKPVQYPKWGRDAQDNAVLYMTAQEDPDATEGDLAPPAPAIVAEAPPPAQPSEAENLRAQIEEMGRMMAAMQEQTLAAKKEAAEATAKAEQAAQQAEATTQRRPPGRPRKAA